MKIALATCEVLPEPDPDQELLVEALRAAGANVALVPWDGPSIDWQAFDLCVLRSTWNYFLDWRRFMAWVQHVDQQTTLVNPFPAVRWNFHKRYLAELAQDGISVVPTRWVSEGASMSEIQQALGDQAVAPSPPPKDACAAKVGDQQAGAPAALDRESIDRWLGEGGSAARAAPDPSGLDRWSDIVVKPAISAASYRTRRFAGCDHWSQAASFVEQLAADGDVMIQPYLHCVEKYPERAIIWIDGEVTHAVEKSPRFVDQAEQVQLVCREPTASEIELVERAIARWRDSIVYARADVFPDSERLWLSELELIEPSLYFANAPQALERFVAALMARAVARASHG